MLKYHNKTSISIKNIGGCTMKRRYFHRHTVFFLAFILSLTTLPFQTYAATSQTNSIENMYMTHYYPAIGRTEAYTYTFDSATRATYSNDT